MPYTPTDKYEMSLRQAKVDIGQGRGNAMTNAVNLCIASGHKFESDEKMFEWIYNASDQIFHYNQVKIDADFKQWFEANDHQLRLDTGLEVPTIDQSEPIQFPKK